MSKLKKGTEVQWTTNGRGTSRTLYGKVIAQVPRGTPISDLKIAKKYKQAIAKTQTKDLSDHVDRAIVDVSYVDDVENESFLIKAPKVSWLAVAE